MNSLMIMISIIIMMKITMSITNNFNKNKNNYNNIECGFNNLNNKKINTTLNFMYILIIFILFDMELMMIIPMLNNMKMNMNNVLTMNLFLMFMLMSTMIEMKNNKMKWNK